MTPRRRRAGLIASAAALVLALPANASAHGLVGKQDLPIPRWLFAWAAAVVLVASFVGLAVLWATPRLQEVVERRRFDVPVLVEFLAGLLGVAFFAFCIYAGYSGTQAATANILPTIIYVFFWVVIPFVSVPFGDVFRAVNPWLAVGKASGWVLQRTGATNGIDPLPYPKRLGRWPAVIGILIFAWVELVYANRDDPSQLATMALAYSAFQLVGMSLYGTEAWSKRADAFGVYFGMFARLSPLHWRDGGLATRPFLAGAPKLEPVAGTVALLCAMIGTTSFDGFSQGKTWNSIVPHLQDFFGSLGLNAEHALEWAGLLGMMVMVFLIALLFRLGVMGMHTVGRRLSTQRLSGAFAHTLIPIAFAYILAHYFSLVAYQGQAIVPLLSDPLGQGHDYFGGADTVINYTWISATGIWYVQVAALILGHVAGLALAHDRALALFEKPRDATRSQYWMLAVMVCFTSLGLWLLSAAAQQ
ncbi:hypothetical protein [Conexibacter woesei]|uniref:hypothetical protein n=1 Tax=Conexibacter woesei TaxID=191495 RepID=UPI00041248EA|nr:hypothetical protein [Conexibacter woesei]